MPESVLVPEANAVPAAAESVMWLSEQSVVAMPAMGSVHIVSLWLP